MKAIVLRSGSGGNVTAFGLQLTLQYFRRLKNPKILIIVPVLTLKKKNRTHRPICICFCYKFEFFVLSLIPSTNPFPVFSPIFDPSITTPTEQVGCLGFTPNKQAQETKIVHRYEIKFLKVGLSRRADINNLVD